MYSKAAEVYKDYFDFDSLVNEIKKYLPGFNVRKFVEAFEFAEIHHREQTRKNGDPYIIHPIETVRNLVNFRVDENTLIAALLHDVPEDTKATIHQIEELFGENVAFLVEGITKLSKVHYQHDMAERQVESLKKLLIHTAKDPRVIIIKLADRLHNMRTLEFINKPEKRSRISIETLEIYAPIANLLGIQGLKSELEDLCFKNLYPDDYSKLKAKLDETAERQKGALQEMMKIIEEKLLEHHIKAEVHGREKSLYSIYKKIVSEHKTLDDIHDRIAIRIITKKKPDCYAVLGLIHDTFNPKPGNFKDYIAVPKVNGYQSIHTTVFGINGVLTEVQIRTEKMHLDAEYGIAAHYFYDDAKGKLFEDQRSSWATKILELQKTHVANNDFISDLKIDIFQDRIFVFTPAGETIDLPKNASAIDFAYTIHTEVGNHAISAEINNEARPITTMLKTGDLVRIVTNPQQKPELYWLSFAKTHIAKNRIKLFLKKESFKNKVDSGFGILQKEMDRHGLGLVEDINFKKLKSILSTKFNFNFEHRKNLFAAIGEGELQPSEIIKQIGLIKDQKGEANLKVTIEIVSDDRKDLLKDVLAVLSKYNANIVFSNAHVSIFTNKAVLTQCIEFAEPVDFSEFCQSIEQVPGVQRVTRRFKRVKISFNLVVLTTIAFWIFHPLLINRLSSLTLFETFPVISELLLYFGAFMLLFTVVYLRKIIQKSFPAVRDMKLMWVLTFLASTLAVLGLLFEFYTSSMQANWLIIFSGIIIMYAYLAYNYFSRK